MRLLVLAFGLTVLTTGAAIADPQQARIEVSGLWCPSCSFIVGEAFQKSASVEVIDFVPSNEGETGVYTIGFDDAETTIEDIAAQPVTYGYTVVVLSVEPSNS